MMLVVLTVLNVNLKYASKTSIKNQNDFQIKTFWSTSSVLDEKSSANKCDVIQEIRNWDLKDPQNV